MRSHSVAARIRDAAVHAARRARRRFTREIRRASIALDRRRGKQIVHLLHIRKTGGTALKDMLRDARAARYRIVRHPHNVTLKDIPVGDKVVYFVRDPVTRFESGFWSRQRQGKPAHDRPWTQAEKVAFGEFSTPNELALALSAADPERRARAEQAMRSITHLADPLAYWLIDAGYLRSREDDILFVGTQETLDDDSRRLASILELPADRTLPTDDRRAHRRPPSQNAPLDEAAVENLKRWYASDYELLAASRALRDRLLTA